MARPITWLPRLHEIRRSVAGTVRSHYTRADIEELFQVQKRVAARLIELLPREKVGTSMLVRTEDLAAFLDRVKEAEDVHALFLQVKEERNTVTRRKIRTFQKDVHSMTLAQKPRNLYFAVGRVEIDFESVEELAQTGYYLALILDASADEIDEKYVYREPTQEQAAEQQTLTEILAQELREARERREKEKAPHTAEEPSS